MIINKIVDYFLVSNESFLNFSKNWKKILWRINFFPLAASLINLISLLITKVDNNHYSGRIIYMSIPPLLCCFSFFLLYLKKQNFALFNGLIILPIVNTIIVLPFQMPFAFTFPLGFGIAAFFLYSEKIMINITYFVSAICVFVIAYNDTKHYHAYTNIYLFVFNFINFTVIFYIIFNFLRNVILSSKKIIEREQEKLANQNVILEDQNNKIQTQVNELQKMHKLQLEYADFNNKITSIVSHDIKSPMTFIKNILKSFRNKEINFDEFLKIVPAIEKEIIYANDLFDEMLIWSKEQSPQADYVPVNLNDITEEVCQAYLSIAQSKGISIINELNNNVIRTARSKYYKIILRNLITNAIKFTNIGGVIRIKSKLKNGMYYISVIDNGQGISIEKINKIKNGESIQSKGTNNEFGTGYGLIFCVDLIQKSEGKLIIESKENEGSSFTFTLPIYNQK